MEFSVSAYTDTGTVKQVNEDSLCVRRACIPGGNQTIMAVICDGMGGLKQGELASTLVVTAFGQWFDKMLPLLPAMCGRDFTQLQEQWRQLLEEQHRLLLDYSHRNQLRMGTTVAAFLAVGDRFCTAHVGDSRIYEDSGRLLRLTRDHTLVEREIEAGRITEEEGRHHPQRNILLQCIGSGAKAYPTFSEGTVRHDAFYMLCSDGLVHELSMQEIHTALNPDRLLGKEEMTVQLRDWTEQCKQRGETDNISAVLIHAREGKYIPPERGIKKLLQHFRNDEKQEEMESPVLIETAQISSGDINLL